MSTPEFTIDVDLLSHFSRFSTYDVGEAIIREGDTDDHVYFILSGAVKATNFSIKGREIWHSELLPGTFFGEMAALTGACRSVNIVAEQPTRLAVVTREELIRLIHHDPDIGIWIMQELARRLQQRTEKMSAIIAQKLSQRIRAELLRLAKACDASSEGELIIKPSPNWSEMAVRLNTDRENVSREVSALKRIGALEKENTFVRIINVDLLENSQII